MQLMQAIDVIHLHKHIEKKQDKHNKNKVKKSCKEYKKTYTKGCSTFFCFAFCGGVIDMN